MVTDITMDIVGVTRRKRKRKTRGHNTCGRISPNIKTMVTDITMDIVGVTRRSKKMGNASIAVALPMSRVTNRRCRLLRRGAIASANLRAFAGPGCLCVLNSLRRRHAHTHNTHAHMHTHTHSLSRSLALSLAHTTHTCTHTHMHT